MVRFPELQSFSEYSHHRCRLPLQIAISSPAKAKAPVSAGAFAILEIKTAKQ
jgi:hypothetical protein